MEESQSLARLQRLCSRAEYCRSDIYRKALKDLEGDADAAARVSDALVQERYVSDARYASAFAREKASIQGWGPVKIRFQLRGKGISEADISAALEEIDQAGATRQLDRLLAAKALSLAGDPQIKMKLLKYSLSRGYEYEAVESALKRL